jgi:hypothetical protein
MRNKASQMKIVRLSKGVPALAASPDATVLECGVSHSTRADWKWLDDYTRAHQKIWSRRVSLRQKVLRRYCGTSLISACGGAKSSVFVVIVDPKKKRAILWEERRRQPSGRVIIRYGTG